MAVLLLLPFLVNAAAIPKHRIRYAHHAHLHLPEPSDIALDSLTGHYYIVSDHGILYECDSNGAVLRKAEFQGEDFEGVWIRGDRVYVADERPRKVYAFDRDSLRMRGEWNTPASGKPNNGFEGITWNETKHCFVLVKEKNPVAIMEYDEDFKPLHQYEFESANDLSGVCWWRGAMYLLSDEDACIFRCDPQTYAPLEKFSFDILNPEGLAFGQDGSLRITSDLMQEIYFFPPLTPNNQ